MPSSRGGSESRIPPPETPLFVSSFFLPFPPFRSPEPPKEILYRPRVPGPRHFRKVLPEYRPVRPRQDPVVEESHHPETVPAPQQTPHSLAQREHGLGKLVLGERVPAPLADSPYAGRHHGIGRGGKRKLVDDHATQRFPGHVDPFPERPRSDQYRVLLFPERPQQVHAGAFALHVERERKRIPKQFLQRAQRTVTGAKDEGPAAGERENSGGLPGGGGRKPLVARIREVGRDIYERLPREVKLIIHNEFPNINTAQADAFPEIGQVPRNGKGGGGQEDRARLVPQHVGEDRGDLDGRAAEGDGRAAPLPPCHRTPRFGRQDSGKILDERPGSPQKHFPVAFRRSPASGGLSPRGAPESLAGGKGQAELFPRAPQLFGPPVERGVLRKPLEKEPPLPFPRGNEQAFRRAAEGFRRRERWPPPFPRFAAGAGNVAAEFLCAPQGNAEAEKRGGNLLDAVGFVQDHNVGGGKDVGAATRSRAEGQVGEEEVMVDDHQVRDRRPSADLHQ